MIHRYSQNTKGFTIVELMVVITIIGIISLIAMTVAFEARKSSRDTVRVNEITELRLGIRLYKEAHGGYPTEVFDMDETLGTSLEAFLGEVKGDPKKGDDYYYRYDPAVSCQGTNETEKVIYAKTVELENNKNYNEVCTCTEDCGFDGGTPVDGFVVLIKGETYAQSSYYTQSSYYSQSNYYTQSSYYSQSNYYSQSSYAPVYAQCTPSSHGSWAGDWPSPPQAHDSTWQTWNGGYHRHRCCDGTVEINSGGLFSGPPSWPSCN